MSEKRSQITAFIMIGLILLMALFFIYFIKKGNDNSQANEIEKVPLMAMPVKNYVESCMKSTGMMGIDLVSKQGGYYTPSEQSINNTAYYFYLGESLVPSFETIESELSRYFKDNIQICLDDFKTFRQQGYDITGENIDVKTLIKDNSVDFQVTYPLTITTGSSTAKISAFSASVNSPLKKMYDISNEIIDNQKQDPDFIQISVLIDIAEQNNITYTTAEDEEGNVIYSLVDREPITSEFPELEPEQDYYKFLFAVKYTR